MTQPVLLIDGELAFINQEDLVTRHLQQQLVVEAVEFLIGFQHQASLGIEDIRPAGSPEHFTDGYDRVFAVGYEYSFRRVYRRFRTVDRDQAG